MVGKLPTLRLGAARHIGRRVGFQPTIGARVEGADGGVEPHPTVLRLAILCQLDSYYQPKQTQIHFYHGRK